MCYHYYMLGTLSKRQALEARQSMELSAGVHFSQIRNRNDFSTLFGCSIIMYIFHIIEKKRQNHDVHFSPVLKKSPKKSRRGGGAKSPILRNYRYFKKHLELFFDYWLFDVLLISNKVVNLLFDSTSKMSYRVVPY